MLRRVLLAGIVLAVMLLVSPVVNDSQARAAGRGQPSDWSRFFYYPHVLYPHNFRRPRDSFDHMYYRYGPERRIPVFNKTWHNFYMEERPYHRGHHFILDVF